MAIVESFDGFANLRNGLHRIASERGDWAGIPMPLTGERLVVEPTYPKAKELSDLGKAEERLPDGIRQVNSFYSHRHRCEVLVWREGGKIQHGLVPAFHGLGYALSTLNCQEAWGIKQEANAVDTLASLVSHRQFKQYLLTGMFVETSKRSGVAYLFRRLRPTVAIRCDESTNRTRILCALCMHPIAYYADSWAGAMCPTDDLIAHLMLMRADEPMFWRRSNQHSPHRPESGL